MLLPHPMLSGYNHQRANGSSPGTLCGRACVVQTPEGRFHPLRPRPPGLTGPGGRTVQHRQGAAPAKTGRATEAHNKLTLPYDKQSVFVPLIKI